MGTGVTAGMLGLIMELGGALLWTAFHIAESTVKLFLPDKLSQQGDRRDDQEGGPQGLCLHRGHVQQGGHLRCCKANQGGGRARHYPGEQCWYSVRLYYPRNSRLKNHQDV